MSTQKPATRFKDPMAVREAEKYEHPVPSREAVLACLAEAGEPLSFQHLTALLGVEGERDLDAFGRRLRAMERGGQLLKNRRGRYGLIDKMDMVHGTVSGHADGFGFLIPDPDEGGEDLFLSPKEMRKVLHGDRVVGRVTGVDARGRREGAIIEVLEHRHSSVVGRYSSENGMGFIEPDDKRVSQDILIPPGAVGDARHGQMVVAAITQQPTARQRALGRIVEVLGDHMAPGMEIEVIMRRYELPQHWPADVLEEGRALGTNVPEAAIQEKGRHDLRRLPLVTIDGADAKDFDDAVYCERRGKGWRLFVAIADVSHYVTPDSALDREAYHRGTSVYFPGRVIPMLPEALSNGLCSLMPDVDRLCMVCEMDISARGQIQAYRFHKGVMRSQARLTYSQVAAMLVDKDAALRERYHTLLPHLEELYQLYKMLHKVRLARGSVDFDLPETRIVFDTHKKIERIVPVERNDAHRLIEECMLAANICAAEFLNKHKVPAPYRIHAGPSEDKLRNLREFLFELGLKLGGGGAPSAKDYSKLLQGIAGRAEARLVQTVMLRSLSQAVYSPDNIGHFALAFPRYTHFTSPIRRYPDLMVHRSIKAIVDGKGGRGSLVKRALKGMLGRSLAADAFGEVKIKAEHCSMTSRRADEASWDVIKWLKTEYMMERMGEEFEGLISGVTNFGIFVELKDVFVEGLVHITALGNDYYHFDPVHHRLTGERTRQTFRLADEVSVRVARVDLDEARIDFDLTGRKERPRRNVAARKKAKSKKSTAKAQAARTEKPPRKVRRGKTAAKKAKAQGKKSGRKRTRR